MSVSASRPASAFAEDLVSESGGADAEAELVQSRVGGARRAFAVRPNGEAEYRLFRRFLVEHPVATEDKTLDGLLAAGLSPPDLYEPIPTSCLVPEARNPSYWPCPRCGWPMAIVEGSVRCASTQCHGAGARFVRTGAMLSALGAFEPPAAQLVAGRMRQRRGVWRYTLQPGLVELDLTRRLERLSGVRVDLWPDRDRYDLCVTRGDRIWAVDVKDWSSAAALADHFRRLGGSDDPLVVVVPDWRGHQVPILKDRCGGMNLIFRTARQFVADVRAAVGREGGTHEGK